MSPSIKIRHTLTFSELSGFIKYYFGRSPWMIFGGLFFIFLASVVDIFTPQAYAWLVDVASTEAVGSRQFENILYPVVAIVLLSCLFHVLTRCAHLINCYLDSNVHALVAAEAVRHVHSFETEWHTNTFAGSIVTAIKRGRSAAHRLYDTFCYDIFRAIIIFIGGIALTYNKSPVIAFSLVIYAICFTWFSSVISLRLVAPKNRIAADEDSRLGGAIADSVTGYSAVKAVGGEVHEYERIKFAGNRFAKAARTAWIRANFLGASQNIVINIGRLVAMILASYYWAKGLFTPGDVMFTLIMQRTIADALDGIGNRLRDIIESINDLEEVVSWRLRRPLIASNPDSGSVEFPNFSIKLDNVTFQYTGQAKPAIKNFSLEITPGEKVALVGKTGSGKSTLFKLLHRYYLPQSGSIMIDGQNIEKADLPTLRRQLALVSQEPVLFHRSLAENIAYSNPNASMEEIKQAAELAQIAPLIDSLPKKYETLVGERGIKLSGGERQRVAIARAIIADARVILLDEATSSLDNETERVVQSALGELTKGRSVLAIAHRISTIQSFDRIIVMEHGEIVETGSHAELLEKRGAYYRLYTAHHADGIMA